MREKVIEVSGLKVSFLIQPDGISSIKQFLFSLGSKKLFTRKSVLKGLDLEIYKGECVGILGRNGSGKSTLLRTLAGIITPDEGQVNVQGRVAPMLGLGVGLEPELTGLENIELLGILRGLTKAEVQKSSADIIDFSELGEDIHLQVKRYSSGMTARLAFAIATTRQPDILIVDEALGVGDSGFQQKCFNRIDQLRKQGTTILYVSHHMSELRRICDRAVFMVDGKIEYSGEVETAIEKYQAQF